MAGASNVDNGSSAAEAAPTNMALSLVPTFKLRLLAAAIGSLVSGAAALIGALTGILGIIGAVGIPVGAVIGYWLAPRLLVERSIVRIVMVASVVALPLGIGLFGFFSAVAESAGATALDVVSMTLLNCLMYGIFGVIFGWPMALVVGAVAARQFRRLAPRGEQLFRRAATVVAIVAVAVGSTFVAALVDPGDSAARRGDSVGLEYRVDNLSGRDYTFDVRSYWKGSSSGGESGSLGQGTCVLLGKGNDALQSSDWAIFLRPPESDWVDRPAETPIVTNREYKLSGTVRLTIVVGADGSAQVTPGIIPGCPEF
jgi:hypothetical protein